MTATWGETRKKNGAYYTPPDLATVLARWAIRSSLDTVLDPSYGGCAFLTASLAVLKALGCAVPTRSIWGVDADPQARRYTRPFIADGAYRSQFLTADFLAVRPEALRAAGFSVVLANPPYVRYQTLSGRAVKRGTAIARAQAIHVPRTASYWAYFVVHLLDFLAAEGRAALVLPAAFLTAGYARNVRQLLFRAFRKVTVLLVRERLFPDAKEATVLVLGDGFGRDNESVRIGVVSSAEELSRSLENLSELTHPIASSIESDLLAHITGSPARELCAKLLESGRVCPLGDIAGVQIGTVTGANRFFLLRPSEAVRHKLDERDVRPFLVRAHQAKGLRVVRNDLRRLLAEDAQALLVSPVRPGCVRPSLAEYYAYGVRIGAHTGYKCRKRRPWYIVPGADASQALMPYMVHQGVRLILNEAGVGCSNNFLRVRWRRNLTRAEQRALAVASVSTVTQFSAEIRGRMYGGGVLKLEPRDAERVLLPVPSVRVKRSLGRDLFLRADALVRNGDLEGARRAVDDALVQIGLISQGELGILEAALAKLRGWRMVSS